MRGTAVADLSRSIADLRRAFTPQRSGVDYRPPGFVGPQADLRSSVRGLADPLLRWGALQPPRDAAASYDSVVFTALPALSSFPPPRAPRAHSRHAPMLSSRVAMEARSALSPETWG